MSFVKKHIALLLCLLFIAVPYIYSYSVYVDSKLHLKIFHLFLFVGLLILPLFFLKKRNFAFVSFVLYFFIPFDIINLVLNFSPIYRGVLLSVADTNFNEAKELLLSFLPLLISFLFIGIAYIFLAAKKIPNEHFIEKTQNKFWVRTIVIFSLSIIFALSLLGVNFGIIGKNGGGGSIVHKTFNSFYKHHLVQIYPFDIVFSGVDIFLSKREINAARKNMADIKMNAVSNYDDVIVVFVIGETARGKNFSLNGYSRKTNPNLEQINNLVYFPHYYSAANATVYSIPFILTGIVPVSDSSYEQAVSSKTFVDAFIEAGFGTYWFSNQNSIGTIVERTLEDVNEYMILNRQNEMHSDSYDSVLFEPLDKVLSKKEKRKMIVLHTMGSHYAYSSRYPQEFAVFNPSFKQNELSRIALSAGNKEKLINSYDNSILYTDYILSVIIKKLDNTNKPAVFIYVSDHGENLFDDSRNFSLHANPIPTKYTMNVPLILWVSDEYKQKYPKNFEEVQKNKNTLINSSNIFFTILDLAGISFNGLNLTKSLSNDRYEQGVKFYWYSPNGNAKILDIETMRETAK